MSELKSSEDCSRLLIGLWNQDWKRSEKGGDFLSIGIEERYAFFGIETVNLLCIDRTEKEEVEVLVGW